MTNVTAHTTWLNNVPSNADIEGIHIETVQVAFWGDDYTMEATITWYIPRPPPEDFVGDYFGAGIFIGGVIMMIYAPAWVAWKIKKVGVTPDSVERAGYAMLIFLLGLGLFLGYIYRGV